MLFPSALPRDTLGRVPADRGPAIPSGIRPFHCWKAVIAWLVRGPSLPSTWESERNLNSANRLCTSRTEPEVGVGSLAAAAGAMSPSTPPAIMSETHTTITRRLRDRTQVVRQLSSTGLHSRGRVSPAPHCRPANQVDHPLRPRPRLIASGPTNNWPNPIATAPGAKRAQSRSSPYETKLTRCRTRSERGLVEPWAAHRQPS